MQSAVKNAASPKQVKNAEKIREEELNDIRTVMSTEGGRRFMWRLLNHICHYDANDFHHSGSVTNFSLGERNVARLVKSDIYMASVEGYQQMERENWALLKGEK